MITQSNAVITRIDGPIRLDTRHGQLYATTFTFKTASLERTQVVLHTSITPSECILARIHSACLFGEAFYGLDCDCRAQLDLAIDLVIKSQNGMIIYLNQEGRGVGLPNKVAAMELEQRFGLDTVEAFNRLGWDADLRNYDDAIAILRHYKVDHLKLITNSPHKANALTQAGIIIDGIVPAIAPMDSLLSIRELLVKKNKMGHILPGLTQDSDENDGK